MKTQFNTTGRWIRSICIAIAGTVIMLLSLCSSPLQTVEGGTFSDTTVHKVTDSIPVDSSTTLVVAYAGWLHTRQIVVNTTTTGAPIDSAVLGYPLLIRLNSTNFDFSTARPNGADLRFATNQGKRVPYQIDKWDAAHESAAIWILIDTLFPGTNRRYAQLYWGNDTAQSQSRGAAVFDTTNGFSGVWHMQIDSGEVLDATGFANNGTPLNYNGNESTEGCIGSSLATASQSFGFIQIADKPELRLGRALTVSAWVKGRGYGNMICKNESSATGNASEYAMYYWSPAFAFNSTIGIDSSHSFYSSANAMPDSNTWNYVAVVYDGTSFYYETNGTYEKSSPDYSGPILPGTGDLCFQANSTGEEACNLPLDEIRISRVVRSKAWLQLDYETQRPDQKSVIVR